MAYFRMIASTINNSRFELFGDGTVERDFTYIDDVVRSIILLIDELKKHKFGFTDLVNLGGGNPTSINTLIEIVEKVSNKKVNISKEISNLADVKKTMSNDKYLKLLIGNSPYTNIMDGITKTISWANENCIKTNLNQWII
jgi:UDP-glucuronate 4-epimerase